MPRASKLSPDTFADTTPAVDGIRVGVGGWTYAPWRANFYPAGLVQRRELEFASRRLSAIEINGTFYGAQKPATYASWAAQTPEGFVFSVKAPMRIVQAKVLAKTGGQVEDFLGGLVALGDRLGPVVWQFESPNLDREDLTAFLELLPRQIDGHRIRHVLDVRSPGFVDARYVALAREHGVATVFTDSREFPSFSDITADFIYARLMRSRGEIAQGYSEEELEHWAARARIWARGGVPDDLPRITTNGTPPAAARDVFVYFISAAKERNPAAAMALIERLKR